MKEAAGEANLTVIAIVLIGIVAAIATPLISGMMKNMKKQSCCQSLGGKYSNGSCSQLPGGPQIPNDWDKACD